jgi:hypothetical protein
MSSAVKEVVEEPSRPAAAVESVPVIHEDDVRQVIQRRLQHVLLLL